MTTKINPLNGNTIRASLTEALNAHVMELNGIAVNDMMPRETKVARRSDAIVQAAAVITEAEAAFRAWAQSERESALSTLAQRPVGSAAEESRRVADELRLSRMIDTARATGTPATAAKAFAADAAQAYLDATGEDGYREAVILADAAIALGGASVPGEAARVREAASRRLETPAQQKARATLATLDLEDLATQRDLKAQAASLLSAGAKAAEAAGDDRTATEMKSRAAQASMTSKMLAFKLAQETEQAYVQPTGALPDRPTGEVVRMTDGMAARLTHNIDSGVIS